MEKIIDIIMRRDGLSRDEAEELVRETREEVLAAGEYSEAEDIFMENLGLEIEYLIDLIL